MALGITVKAVDLNCDQPAQVITECDEIEVKLEITNTLEGMQSGKIVLNFEKSAASYTCFRSISSISLTI
jgi:hypothetical protein